MFIPQVTSGPSAAAWSPDGTELIYSMQGSLWRQRVDCDGGPPAHRWPRLRLPAGLVSRRPPRGLRVLSGRRDRASAARPRHREGHPARGRRRGESGAALVARRGTDRVHVHPVPGPLARIRGDGDGRRSRRRGGADHRGQGERAPAVLLQHRGSVPVAHLVARRTGADPGVQPWACLGLGHVLADAGARGRGAAGDPRRGDHLEGASRLEPRWPAGGVQLVRRPAVAPALADDGRRRESAAAHLRGVRRHRAALVARRAADRLRVERGRRRQHVAPDRRSARRGAARDPR